MSTISSKRPRTEEGEGSNEASIDPSLLEPHKHSHDGLRGSKKQRVTAGHEDNQDEIDDDENDDSPNGENPQPNLTPSASTSSLPVQPSSLNVAVGGTFSSFQAHLPPSSSSHHPPVNGATISNAPTPVMGHILPPRTSLHFTPQSPRIPISHPSHPSHHQHQHQHAHPQPLPLTPLNSNPSNSNNNISISPTIESFPLSPHDTDEELEPVPIDRLDVGAGGRGMRGVKEKVGRGKGRKGKEKEKEVKEDEGKAEGNAKGKGTKEEGGESRRVRAGRACINCRKLKMKCLGADDPPCKRCEQSGRVCEFERRADYVMNPEDMAWQQRVDERLSFLHNSLTQILEYLKQRGVPVTYSEGGAGQGEVRGAGGGEATTGSGGV